jgi:pyruvate dehydrogenase E2 component (dihydrolipoamide acetyltransferase)
MQQTSATLHATRVVMPRLSDSMEEGTVRRWLVADGHLTRAGQPLVDIETDKAILTYEAETDGVLKILVSEGETRAVGELIATIGDPGETPDQFGARPETQALARVRASPVARRLAAEEGLDLAQIPGSGRLGTVMKSDVVNMGAAATARAPSSALVSPPAEAGSAAHFRRLASERPSRMIELSHGQKIIARRMCEARKTIPDFTLSSTVPADELLRVRESYREAARTPPSITDIIIRACALALRDHPKLNASFRAPSQMELHTRIDIGFAVALDDGLLVPVVRDADGKSLSEVGQATRALADRARRDEATPQDLADPTFTVSNLGMFGVTEFEAVINPPQAAILAVGGVGSVVRMSDDGQITRGEELHLSLSCDHRVVYGADAAKFLARLRTMLEHPILLAL